MMPSSARIKILLLLLMAGLLSDSLRASTCRDSLQPRFEGLQYRATVDVLDKHLSGILIMRTMEDGSVRTVFTNEMGVTFFDLSFTDQGYTYHRMMDGLDRKPVRLALAKDIGMILMRGIFKAGAGLRDANGSLVLKLQRKGTVHYYPDAACRQSPRIVNRGRRKEVVSIDQFYLPGQSMPDSIFVAHHTVSFTIRLKHFHAAE